MSIALQVLCVIASIVGYLIVGVVVSIVCARLYEPWRDFCDDDESAGVALNVLFWPAAPLVAVAMIIAKAVSACFQYFVFKRPMEKWKLIETKTDKLACFLASYVVSSGGPRTTDDEEQWQVFLKYGLTHFFRNL